MGEEPWQAVADFFLSTDPALSPPFTRPPPHTPAAMSTPAPKSQPGDMASFNILHGFPEALVRGMRSSFLADADYHHLTQCETLDDVRLNLSETDYADALADMNALIPTGLQKAAVEKVRLGAGVDNMCRGVLFWHWMGEPVENKPEEWVIRNER